MDIFTYVPKHRVFICCICHQVISPSHIETHILRQPIHKLRHHSRRVPEFRAFFQQYPDRLLEINHLAIPIIPTQVIPQLLPPQTGFRCQSDPAHCQYVCCDLRSIGKHCRAHHNWQAPRQRGRPRKTVPIPSESIDHLPWKVIVTQKFSPKGPLSRYFEVQSSSTFVPSSIVANTGNEFTQKKRLIQDRLHTILASQHQAISEGHYTEANPWLDMVGWATHLQAYQHHRAELRSLLDIPSTDIDYQSHSDSNRTQRKKRTNDQTIPTALSPDHEQMFNNDDCVLAEICVNFDEIIRIGQNTVQEKVNWSVRFEINKKEQAKPEQRPFHARLLNATMSKYRYVWKQLICYIVRSTLYQQQPPPFNPQDIEHPFPQNPRFQFTPHQQTLYLKMWQSCKAVVKSRHEHLDPKPQSPIRNTLLPVQQTLLSFLISLLDHPIQGNEFENAILSGLAVLGLDPVQGWVSPLSYTPSLSAVVKLARIMVVQHAWELHTSSTIDHDSSCFDQVRKCVHRFMVIDQPVPMSRIYHIRTYGLKIRYNTTAEGRVDWTGQGQQSRYISDGVEFTKHQFQSMVHGMLHDCRSKLTQKLLLISRDREDSVGLLPSIPWDSLRDNPSCETPGWNFTYDRHTSWPKVDAQWWLWDRIQHNPQFRRQFLQKHDQDGPQHLRKAALKEWLLELRRFKELLLILVHICGGQPPRGSEILSVKHTNTVRSRRNFFIEDGMVVYVTEYHKGYSASGSLKIIHRYLPREVGELYVYYMWLVLPFEHQTSVEELGAQQLSPFMWTLDGAAHDYHSWQVDDLTKLLQCESVRYMGPLGRIGVASYRHSAIAFSRRFCGDYNFQSDNENEEEQEEDETTWYNGQDAARDLQAGHGTHIAGSIYARSIFEASGVIETIRTQFRQESKRWHTFVLGLKPHLHDTIIQKRLNSTISEEGKKRQRQQYLMTKSINISTQLQRLLGSGARFRGLQERAITAIMNQEDPIICIMGTGGGKSLLFLLPSFCQFDTTTIVVVPSIALREDMIQRCTEDGITCYEWKETPPVKPVQITFVTPESALSSRFQSYINLLRRNGSLARVVIDEVHIVLDSTLTFRPLLQEFASLLRLSVQMLYLTATLPPEDEPRLFELMQIDPYRAQVMRESTSRANISYSVHDYDGSDESTVILIREELQRCKAIGGRLIVYSNRIARVNKLASALGCAAYHSDLVPEVRSNTYRQLRSGEIDLVVATNGLGCGIDVPNIYGIIHAEIPHKLRDYAQESGRAGRDGTISKATILRAITEDTISDWRVRPSHRNPILISNGGETYMQAFCRGDKCRRVILDDYIDGSIVGRRERIKCEEDEAACDVCVQHQSQTQNAKSIENFEHMELQAQLLRRQEWLEQLNRLGMTQQIATTDIRLMLTQWHNKCPLCYISQHPTPNHTLELCQQSQAADVLSESQRFSANIKYAKYSACWECGIPQAICDHFQPHPRIAGGYIPRQQRVPCQYPNTVIPTVMTILFAGPPDWAEAVYGWMQADQVNPDEASAVMEWFGRKVCWSGIEMNLMMKVFCILVRLVDRKET